jgi:hypothetical protein
MGYRRSGLMAALMACLALAGCRVMEEKLAKVGGQPVATPTKPALVATPAPAPAPTPAPAAEAPKVVEPEKKAEAAPAKAVETKPVAEEAKAAPSKPPLSPEAADADLRAASAGALQAAAQAMVSAQRRAAAEALRADWIQRRAAFAEAARDHARYLAARIAGRNQARALKHLALLAGTLDGVRRNLGGEPADDQLELAVAALHGYTQEAGSEDAAVKQAIAHLKLALDLLPLPAEAKPAAAGALAAADEKPAASLNEEDASTAAAAPAPAVVAPASAAALAVEVQATLDLLGKDKVEGRRRLVELVLVMRDTAAEEQLDLLDVTRKWLLDALGRGDWAAADRNVKRLGAQLDELAKLVAAPAPAPAPANAGAQTSTAPAEAAPSKNAEAPQAESPKAESPKAETPKAGAPKAAPNKAAPAKAPAAATTTG